MTILYYCKQMEAYLDLLCSHQFTRNDSVFETRYWVTFRTNFLNLLPRPVTVQISQYFAHMLSQLSIHEFSVTGSS